LLLKFLPLAYNHSHFLAATSDFTSFFTTAFLGAALFFTAGLFWIRYVVTAQTLNGFKNELDNFLFEQMIDLIFVLTACCFTVDFCTLLLLILYLLFTIDFCI